MRSTQTTRIAAIRTLTLRLSPLMLAMAVNVAYGAQDYNSSRSNNSSSVATPDETVRLLELSKAEAMAVAQSMIEVDQRDGYSGDYKITVTVSVSIERAPKGADVVARPK